MAIIAPFLILLIAGLVEVGRFANFSILVSNAARAGVQYGAQNLATAQDRVGTQNAATADAQNAGGISATASFYCKCANGTTSTCQSGDCATNHRIVYVQVDTTGVYQSIIHYPGFPGTLTVTDRAVMRVAQ
jgi:Flp pilus assembly protein TadG